MGTRREEDKRAAEGDMGKNFRRTAAEDGSSPSEAKLLPLQETERAGGDK